MRGVRHIDAGELVAYLQDLGVRLRAEGERLRVSAPKGKLPTDLRAEIAECKADILALLRQRPSTKRLTPGPIKPRASGEPAPLSFAQERLWFLGQLEPQSAAYNICRASRLVGNLNPSALEASLNESIGRHETLRTAFRLVDGRPVQVVEASQDISIQRADVSRFPEIKRADAIRRRIRAEAERPFDLSAGPLLRCILLHVSDQEHVLILLTHHIVADAWSLGILARELWTLYEAFSNGKSSPLEPLLVQYSDYAVWQRDWLQGDVLDSQLAYWKNQLNDLPILNLPTDRPRKPRQSFRGARLTIALAKDLTSAVNEMSRRFGVTPYMSLLGAFQVLLHRYTGQEIVVVGSPIANRRRPEIEELIGFFVNTLVLRADLSGNPSFSEYLLRVRDSCVAADTNQDLPFEKLVQELQPERDQSRNPLFQVMFVLQNATRPFTEIRGLRIEPIKIEVTRSPFDLSLFLRERDGKYIGYVEYCTDLFDRDRIERMAGHYQTLLEGVVADPDQPIPTLPILTEAERHKILVEWNDTAADYPKNKCIYQLFEKQVERAPDAIVVEFEDQRITYGELNRRANQLAHHLIRLGIGPEKLVGICVERSIEMVIGLLGILKAGGAYVPLDPAYPRERLRFMMQDAQVSAVVTQENLLDRIQHSELSTQHFVVCLDRDWPSIAQHEDDNPKQAVISENLVYVNYTSGSTGKPKGVQVSHRSVVNCLYSMAQQLGFTNRNVLLAVTTISFDIAALEFYLPLLIGGKVIVTRRDDAMDGTKLRSRLMGCSATAMQATPSTWWLLLEAGWKGACDFKILCGGEALSRELAEKLLAHGILWNLYGPTETTIWSTFHSVKPGDGAVAIGRPMANTQIYLLDAHLQPVPIGVHGELYIGGDGLARGYLNRPELTAERFIRNPLTDDPNSRLYRTGDRARYRADGNIEFLGRSDNQVKIHGHRIELGEIEAALNQHPAVQGNVIVARDCGALEEKDLIGYVVPTIQSAPSITELRRFLQQTLPDHMIPPRFVFLDALPLTPNGKLDRNALPPPDRERPPLDQGFVVPRTEIEELIAQVWREVLKRDEISVHDNFFDLGGHSLLAIQIISRVREAFDKDVPLLTLFEMPTVAGLAVSIEKPIRTGSNEPPPILPVPRDGPLPLSVNQEDLWRVHQMIPGTHFFNVPCVYRLTGDLNVSALEKTLQEIIGRHEALRTIFVQGRERPTQIVKATVDFELSVVDLRRSTGGKPAAQTANLIVEERLKPFDLSAGPLIRAKLLRLTAKENLLLVTFHHIICDQWSIHVIRGEVATLYDALSQGRSLRLPSVPIQFADYASWERKSISGDFMQSQLEFWKKQLAEPLTELEFGKQTGAQDRTNFSTSHEPLELDDNQLRRIKSLGTREGCTSFMVLVAALSVTLFRLSRETDIRIGTLVANRRRKETEWTVGHIVNTVILRIRLSPQMQFAEVLRHVRDVTLAAHAHQELPFEYVARVLEQERGVKRSCLFQVLLMYQNTTAQSWELSDLTLARLTPHQLGIDRDLIISSFDLIFDLREASTKLAGALTYKNNALDKKDVAELLGTFKEILNFMTFYREQSIAKAFLDDRA